MSRLARRVLNILAADIIMVGGYDHEMVDDLGSNLIGKPACKCSFLHKHALISIITIEMASPRITSQRSSFGSVS